ncbi:MAG TPA: DEAD/DEAH box helicase [Syntrophales bacterium]|nr:DEAD/DEAH box helicase [Syntrophales bacterium]HOM06514.1 DEAD/DEAH box helicase [Syntrophales bacterium]HON99899.1 DEAD/DEAH box helicase [Syntrophales bacterium]HPC00626.1 DEAD/DEAH box helicase [Syntrophales bacterium]HPQ06224.1 DEAD/DEAH box helicase [Syntrophales bacterium]
MGEETNNGQKDLDVREERIIEPENPLPPVGLEELPEGLRAACARAGWTRLLPVQSRTIPYLIKGRNMMVQSQTGSGKTGAFLLPILDRIDPARKACQALVLTPTRELALQVAREAEVLYGDLPIRVAAVYGGVKYGPQLAALREGAHLVVGTPGRILDHLLKETFNLDGLSILVFDEADRMLSMGFYPDMRRIRQFLPRRPINAAMFSATFPGFVLRLAGEFLRNPEFLSLSADRVHVDTTDHVYYVVPGMQRERSLVRIIEAENPVSALIFCNTKSSVHFVAVVLKRFGYDADELSSDLAQAARERVMGRIKRGSLRFLVATDVAARGIDIPDLSHVIQYEPPEDPELYIHRAGRTGRVGAVGTAITMVAGMEQFKLKQIARTFSITMREKPLPTEEEVGEIVAQRVVASLEADLRARGGVEMERLKRFMPLARSLGEAEEESPLIAMLLDEYYQRTLQAAPLAPVQEAPETEGEEAPPAAAVKRGKRRGRRGRRGESVQE